MIGIGTIQGGLANNKFSRYLLSLADAVKAHQENFGNYVEIELKENTDPQMFLESIIREVHINRFEIMEPSLNDIFISSVQQHRAKRVNNEQ